MDKIKRRTTIAEDRGVKEALSGLAESIIGLPIDRVSALFEYLEEKELYTVEELGKVLKMAPLTIRRAIKRGEIECIRLGTGEKSPIRFNKKQVEFIIANGFTQQ